MATRKYQALFMAAAIFSCLFGAALGATVVTDTKSNSKTTTTTAKAPSLDPDKLEKSINGKVGFTSTSNDQKAIDETLTKNQEVFDNSSFSHIQKLEECQALKSVEEIQNCRKEYLKNNK